MPASRPTTRFFPGARRTVPLFILLIAIPAARADEDPGPRAAAAAVQSAFTDCDPGPIRPFLSRRLKTYLSLGGTGPDSGYYGADQAALMLQRLFARRATLRFTLAAAPEHPGHGPVVLTGRWTFRYDGSERGESQLTFVLATEPGGWRIREIRARK
jgi:hypothetical protein